MGRLDRLYGITMELNALLDQPIDAKNREVLIEKINELVEERGVELKKVTPPFSDKEKEVGKKVVGLNERLDKAMDLLFTELKQDIKQLKKQKKSNRSYVNPYRNLKPTDGMYMDSKQ